MRETAVRQLRAYVGISKAFITFLKEKEPEIQVHIRNSGQTPAYDVRMWIGAGLGSFPVDGKSLKPPPTGAEPSSSVLGPGEEPSAMVFQHPIISEGYMPILGTPDLTLYAYGEVHYRDAFGNQRFTKYRLMFGGGERQLLRDDGGLGTAFLRADTEGNEAD
jgi:hypothetical protein